MTTRVPFVAPFEGDLTIKQDGSLWVNGENIGWVANLDFRESWNFRYGPEHDLHIEAIVYREPQRD